MINHNQSLYKNNKYKNKSNDCHCSCYRLCSREWSAYIYGRIDSKANKIKIIENLYKRQTKALDEYEFEIYLINRYLNTACPLNPFSGLFREKKIICFAVMRRITLNDGLSFYKSHEIVASAVI